MAAIISYRDLIAWQKAMDLADLVYTITEQFPQREWFGLAQHMRKAAVSIPSNVAEGHRRRRSGYRHHLKIALGSHAELETQAILAFRRRFIDDTTRDRLDMLCAEVGRVLHGLFASLPPIPDDPNP